MLRIQRKGGEEVGKGNYWRVSDGERVSIDQDGVLPGDVSETYLRFHPAFLLVLGPVLGLVYAVFMPLTAILMAVWVAAEKLSTLSFSALRTLRRLI